MIIDATNKHHAVWTEMLLVFRKHLGEADATDLLAVASQIVGSLIALQDREKVTAEDAMDLVLENIGIANERAIKEITEGRLNLQ